MLVPTALLEVYIFIVDRTMHIVCVQRLPTECKEKITIALHKRLTYIGRVPQALQRALSLAHQAVLRVSDNQDEQT